WPPTGEATTAKQVRKGKRTTHTDTLLRIHAHIPPSLCASAARLLFLSLPCFPPTPPPPSRAVYRSSSRYLYPKAEARPRPELQRCGGGGREGGSQIPVAKSRTIRLQHKRGRGAEKRVGRHLICHKEECEAWGRGDCCCCTPRLAQEISRATPYNGATATDGLVWQLPHPNSEPGVRPLRPSWACRGNLGRPSLAAIFMHLVCPCKSTLQWKQGKHRDRRQLFWRGHLL
ncbi:hypothetical protein CABS01_12006, partial [Colletotrichum abscissum]|uniref:uncharacterized protein n=1 Tax=Colletotrichum abscissum TaxID=1671311 RepID=UPI0027D60481